MTPRDHLRDLLFAQGVAFDRRGCLGPLDQRYLKKPGVEFRPERHLRDCGHNRLTLAELEIDLVRKLPVLLKLQVRILLRQPPHDKTTLVFVRNFVNETVKAGVYFWIVLGKNFQYFR